MKVAHFFTENKSMYGIVVHNIIKVISDSIFDNFYVTKKTYNLKDVKILPPVMPSKIVCVGRNYKEHVRELSNELPKEPLIFLKPSTAVIASNENIMYPEASNRIDYEGELAVIIKKRCKNVKSIEASKYIMGYTCFNDVTARDIQKRENKFTRAKSFDTFAPLGPFIETDIDWQNLNIRTYVNGILKQDSSTKNMIFGVYELIEFISSIMTLLEGDVIATGTPEGVGELKKNDTVSITIESIGTLTNIVV